MSLKMFTFHVTNMRTKEVGSFIGQGETFEEAFRDGRKNCQDSYRANSSGKPTHEHGMAVQLPDGRNVGRTVKEFEGDEPYKG